jgi:hypothetical protein
LNAGVWILEGSGKETEKSSRHLRSGNEDVKTNIVVLL